MLRNQNQSSRTCQKQSRLADAFRMKTNQVVEEQEKLRNKAELDEKARQIEWDLAEPSRARKEYLDIMERIRSTSEKGIFLLL